MKNLLGVMQGRLLPKYKGRYQAHPVGYWQQEFLIARDLGLDCIEFILDFNDVEKNPLVFEGGIEQLNEVIDVTGVQVKSICADYFMEAPLHSKIDDVAKKSQKVLASLLENAKKLGVADIVIPCVDQSSLSSEEDASRFVERITPLLEIAEKTSINFSLETDLAPQAFADLINRFNSKRITVNYDIGNSAALGYDPKEELSCYGHLITDVHIKDRVLGGGPVELGSGSANFDSFFEELAKFNYLGPFIMQAYRDEEGVQIFSKQMEFVKSNYLCKM